MGGDTGKKIGRGIGAVLSGGLSELVIGGMNASDAIGSIGDATEQLGAAIGVIAATAAKVGDELSRLLVDVDDGLIRDRETGKPGELTRAITTLDETVEDIDDLFSIERLTPRNEQTLWPSEKERLDALRAQRTATAQAEVTHRQTRDSLAATLKSKTLPAFPPASWGWISPGVSYSPMFEAAIDQMSFNTVKEVDVAENYFAICGYSDMAGIRALCRNLRTAIVQLRWHWDTIRDIDAEIKSILYREPGLVPATLNNVNETIERFNTLEQPRIEDILDSVDDNLNESQEILIQVKKLFVVKKKKPVVVATLPDVERTKLEWLEKRAEVLESAFRKEYDFSLNLETAIADFRPSSVLVGGDVHGA